MLFVGLFFNSSNRDGDKFKVPFVALDLENTAFSSTVPVLYYKYNANQ